uniref:Uncharacterized protein n=1 Tax=Anguilla anguilla TaxID=7936 RepID=A0A0E9UZ89_ANGAN
MNTFIESKKDCKITASAQ